MTQKKWMQTGIALSLAGAVFLTGCTSDTKTDTPAGDGDKSKNIDATQELTLNLGDEIPTLDVSKATDAISFNTLNATMEGLVRIDKDGKVQPGIASEWKVSDDGLKYTFKLRDTKWSNGDPVTAKDFEYSWKRTLDPKTKGQYAFMVAWVKGGTAYNSGEGNADAVGVKAVDDKTLEVELESPKAFFLNQMAFPTFFPQNQKFVEAQGDKYGTEFDKFLANGPYKMTEWTHDQSAVLAKNENYWDKDAVKMNKITFLMVKDTNTALNLYEAGQLDRTGLVREQIELKANDPELSANARPISAYLMFNTQRAALANKKIRQALTYAIDAEQYVNIILGNGSVPATGIVPKGISDGQGGQYAESLGDALKRKDNGGKAKQLLEEGMKELGLTAPPKLKFLSDDGSTSKKGAEFMLAEWKKKLGLDIEMETVPFKLRLQRSTAGDYDMVMSAWNPDYNDAMTFLDMWLTDGPYNEAKWSNKQYDDLIKNADKEPDMKKRIKMMQDAEKLLLDEMPVGPVYFVGAKRLTKSYVKDLVVPAIGFDFELKWVYTQGKN